MTSKRQRAASAIALLLIFSISQIYVQAGLAGKASSTAATPTAPARAGKLTTRGDNPITVNGNRTTSGTTILPGAQLQTPEGVGASVQLGRQGLLRMSPETSLTLNFNDSNIDVVLNSGYITLTTSKGIKGSITTPDGKTEHTNSATLSTITGQTDDQDNDKNKKKKGGAVLPGSGVDGGEGILGGAGVHAAEVFGLVVLGGAIAASIVIVKQGRGDNLSPFRP
jgi:hypothetical protein